MTYDFDTHRHNFAAWTAARATQRGWTGARTEILGKALERCGVKKFANNPLPTTITTNEFNELHRKWCNKIRRLLEENGVQDVTYGRAAKLLAVYLKSRIIVSSPPACPLAMVVHPPIDRTLLQEIVKDKAVHSTHKPSWRKVNWTTLSDTEYYKLILELRDALAEDEPFWKLEKYWGHEADDQTD
jgi:hypothetical protein